MIEDGTLAISTHGQRVGQINGLSVMDLGDYAFSRPSRITARIGMGREGIVNVEREVDLSGPSHSKGVLILGGYLLGAYAQEQPLSLAARVTFEQVYGTVEGDSASCAELCALLSALADMPLAQGIAITGSINQEGEVQAIGAVTTKVEGFYAVCKAQGFDGTQGVIIPASNVRNLMVRHEIVAAIADGTFHIWPVRSVDEALSILTGVPVGERQPDGSYPEGSLHARVAQRLRAAAQRQAALAAESRPLQTVHAGDADGSTH